MVGVTQVPIRYVKATVRLDGDSPMVTDLRGPYTVPAELDNLIDVLEAVYEYDNLVQEDGPNLTGYSAGYLLDFVAVEWRGRVIEAYCAPRGWLVLNDVEGAEEVNEEAVLPLLLDANTVRRAYAVVREKLLSRLSESPAQTTAQQ